MKRLRVSSAVALSALFGIDILVPALSIPRSEIDTLLCPKCDGVGSFVDYLTKRTRRCDRCGGGGLR